MAKSFVPNTNDDEPSGCGVPMDLIEARQLATGLMQPLESEAVRIEAALGRVLAERVIADRNLPGESRSRLDGFALRSADTLGASPQSPVSLRIIPGHIAAGYTVELLTGPGESIRILTGAPLPPSADAVAPEEEIAVSEETLNLRRPYGRGNGVTLPGDEVKRGEFLLSEGEVLTPVRLAFAAALGRDRIAVYRQPRVALLATGDEVRALGSVDDGPFTYCNNLHLLAWLTELQGGRPSRLGVVRDEPRVIADRLRSVAADLVVTTGGMGKGDRDFIVEVWKELGVRELFRGINLIPGKNTALGLRGGQVFLGVSGNPWAAQIVFQELAVPMLRRWQGLRRLQSPPIAARMLKSLKKEPGFYKAIRGTLDLGAAPPWFTPAEPQGVSVFSRLRDCFAYVILEPHMLEVVAESALQVRLSDFPLLASPLFEGDCSGMASELA
jgi:molybdopterin molybdotransferase